MAKHGIPFFTALRFHVNICAPEATKSKLFFFFEEKIRRLSEWKPWTACATNTRAREPRQTRMRFAASATSTPAAGRDRSRMRSAASATSTPAAGKARLLLLSAASATNTPAAGRARWRKRSAASATSTPAAGRVRQIEQRVVFAQNTLAVVAIHAANHVLVSCRCLCDEQRFHNTSNLPIQASTSPTQILLPKTPCGLLILHRHLHNNTTLFTNKIPFSIQLA